MKGHIPKLESIKLISLSLLGSFFFYFAPFTFTKLYYFVFYNVTFGYNYNFYR